MTVKEWKAELDCYDDDMEVCFEFDDDIDVESWMENIKQSRDLMVLDINLISRKTAKRFIRKVE